MRDTLVILGASGHGKVVADIAEKMNVYNEILLLDDNEDVKQCLGMPVEGKLDTCFSYIDKADMFVAIGNAKIRKEKMEDLLAKGASMPVLIHPTAVLGTGVTIAEGSVVMAGAIINPDTSIGKGCIINTASSVDHDCKISDYVHIAVGAHVAGTVNIEEATWIGAGATVINNIQICSECMVGAGAVVTKNIEEQGTYVGVPAKKIK